MTVKASCGDVKVGQDNQYICCIWRYIGHVTVPHSWTYSRVHIIHTIRWKTFGKVHNTLDKLGFNTHLNTLMRTYDDATLMDMITMPQYIYMIHVVQCYKAY